MSKAMKEYQKLRKGCSFNKNCTKIAFFEVKIPIPTIVLKITVKTKEKTENLQSNIFNFEIENIFYFALNICTC